MMNCDKINELISLYIDNTLKDSENISFEGHIKSCEKCKKDLDDTMQIIQACNEISDEQLPQGFKEELHKRLLIAKDELVVERKDSHKLAFIRSNARLFRVVSALAAVILVVVFLRGIFLNSIYMGSGAPETAMQDKSMEFTASNPQDDAKASYDGGKSESSIKSKSVSAMEKKDEAKEAERPAGTIKPGAEEKTETLNNKAIIQAKGASALYSLDKSTGRSVINRNTSISIVTGSMESDINKSKEIAMEIGGIIVNSDSALMREKVSAAKITADNDNSIELMIPNSQYEKFVKELKNSFSDKTIEFDVVNSIDVTSTINEFSGKIDKINKRIDEIKTKEEDKFKEELSALEVERENITAEIQNLLNYADFTSVRLVLKQK